MSAPVPTLSAQDWSKFFQTAYCINAAAALVVYDWLLCLGEEVTFIWERRSQAGSTLSFLVYAITRYGLLIEILLVVVTNFPMSDLAMAWAQIVAGILGTIAFSTFSALRAYALSNRNIRLTAIIVLLALPPIVMSILSCLYQSPVNLPSPFNCGASYTPSPMVHIRWPITLSRIVVVWRASQLGAESLVVGITWWYSYRSYRIRKGIKLGKTISSLLLYNGELSPNLKVGRFFATIYILDTIFNTATVSDTVLHAESLLENFCDPIASILTCRFMLSLRQFDSRTASTEYSLHMPGSGVQGDTPSVVLQFAAQPSSSLPPSIASFAHPVHVDSALYDMDSDAMVTDGSEWQETDNVVALTQGEGDVLPESSA